MTINSSRFGTGHQPTSDLVHQEASEVASEEAMSDKPTGGLVILEISNLVA